MSDHEYDMSTEEPVTHKFDRQIGNALVCSIPGHNESVILRPSQILRKGANGSLEIVKQEVA